MGIDAGEPISLKIVLDDVNFVRQLDESTFMQIKEIRYSFEISLKPKTSDFNIIKENLTCQYTFFNYERKKESLEIKEKIGTGQFALFRKNGQIEIDRKKPDSVKFEEDNIWPIFLDKEAFPIQLILGLPIFAFLAGSALENITIYNFDPKLSKRAVAITGRAVLEANGENLAIVLKNILENKKKRKKLYNLVQDLLPFVDALDVDRLTDKSLLFNLKESYFKKQLPASFLSDGTINLVALIIALYFQNNDLTIIEEPERCIHPHLISKIVEMMKDAPPEKQIIITTHSPEVIKHAGIENIFFISRNRKGYSDISRPSEAETVKIFLENDMGIDQLYIDNLLGG